MRRLIISVAALAALATPASLFVIGSAAPAGAAVPKSLVCTKITGNAASKVTISGCNVPAADKTKYASATAAKGLALAKGGTVTWASSKATTKFVITKTVTGGKACAKVKGTGEVVATGKVTGGTTLKTVTSVGQVVSVSICLNTTTTAISIAPGTTAKL